MICQCQNCHHMCSRDNLRDVKDLPQRVGPGEPMPAGECPQCGMLSHPSVIVAKLIDFNLVGNVLRHIEAGQCIDDPQEGLIQSFRHEHFDAMVYHKGADDPADPNSKLIVECEGYSGGGYSPRDAVEAGFALIAAGLVARYSHPEVFKEK